MNHLRLVFGSTVFLAAFLLFLVEPIVAKQLLPIFGGSSAVWITCLVFFQFALLGAYFYAHWLAQQSAEAANARSLKRWKIHLAVLALSVLTLGWNAAFLWDKLLSSASFGFRTSTSPILAIFAALSISIGLPFLVLGATSPLLQVWLFRIETGGIPYRLYALSNFASLLALASYPILIEPHFTLKQQWIAWSLGFMLCAFVLSHLTWRNRDLLFTSAHVQPPANPVYDTPGSALTPPLPSTAWTKLLWLLLPMAASMQLSAVTSHLTQNVAAIPLLWILPLAVYLLTLIAAFQFPLLLRRSIATRLLVVMLAGLGYMLSNVDGALPLRITIFFFLMELFVACLFCHTEACALRPLNSQQTTTFYLFFAAGSALGSFIIGVVSPLLFSFNYDLAISFFITALIALAVTWSAGWGQRLLWATTTALMLLLVFFLHTAFHRDTQLAVRNFYGSLRVKQSIGFPPAIVRTLSNGTIQHGSEIFSSDLLRTPTTYYAEDSGVGIAIQNCCENHPRKIGVIGLGVGTIAAYGKAGDLIRFYEINPAVIPIAREVFAYIRTSPARTTITEGDARLSLEQEEPQGFDVLVVDAFSGDAIPLHLLTVEAVRLYQKHLARNGILAFHISNQHVDLEPEIALLAQATGMQTMRFASPINEQRGEFSATWMLMTSDRGFFAQPTVADKAKATRLNPRVRLWTDDYSSLLPVLHW